MYYGSETVERSASR